MSQNRRDGLNLSGSGYEQVLGSSEDSNALSNSINGGEFIA